MPDQQDDYMRLAAAARFADRRRRREHFPAYLFTDPSWDILLFLYANAEREQRRSIASMVMAMQHRPAVLHGSLHDLRIEGLVAEAADDTVEFTERQWALTKHGEAAMHAYLAGSPRPD